MKSLPQDVLDELQRIQKEFLCQRKRAKIKHSTMIGSYEKGGLKVDREDHFWRPGFLHIIICVFLGYKALTFVQKLDATDV